MKLHLDLTALENRMLSLEKQSVTVGILSKGVKSAKIDWSKGTKTKNGGVNGSYQTRYVKVKGRSKNIPLYNLAKTLDNKKGIFTDALSNANNKDVVKVAQEMAILNKSPSDIRRLKNVSRAIIRNPILRGDYNPDSTLWAERKSFNHWGIATGTFFKNIKAEYKKW